MKKNKLNISIDDISPHPKSSTKILNKCNDIISVFNEVKFTLFIPMAFTRLKEKTYFISENENFCNTLSNLSSENFELGWHGYYHGIINNSNNDEFRYLKYNDCSRILDLMYKEAEKAKIKHLFKPIFRPPAFHMSSDCFKCLYENGIKKLCISSKINYNNSEEEFIKLGGFVNYYNANPPLISFPENKDTYAFYHACEWDVSYLNDFLKDDLIKFITNNNFEFVFLGDLYGS